MKSSLLSLLIFFLFLFTSCEKETILTVNQSSLSFENKGGSQTVSIVANKVWSVSSNQSWCKVSPSSGDGSEDSNITISVSCDANDSYDERTCNITVSCGELTKTIAVSQSEGKGLIVSQTEYSLTNEEQTISVEVKANVQYSVEIDNACKSWIKQASTKGLSSNIIQFTISKNNDYDGREGKITIKQTDGSLSGTVVVKQSQQNGLFISTPEYNLSNEKHTLTVEAKANVEFEVSPKVDWIRYVETKGLKTSQIVLEVSANDGYDKRDGSVVVKQKNGELSGTITIHQEQNYGILVSQSEFTLSNEAHTVDVEVKYNVDFDVVILDACKEWVSIVGTKGLSTRTYTFSVAKNESYDDRECSITFKQKNGSLSGTVLIKQSQTDGLIAEKTEYKVTAEEQTLDIKIKSNVSYEVVIDDACKDWLSLVQTKGLTESIVSLFVTKNEGDTRKGKVYLKSDGIQEEITIVQDAEGYVEFEDANFKAYCVRVFDKNNDKKISYAEAKLVTSIAVNTEDIASLGGIECFENLESLTCKPNYVGARLGRESFTLINSNNEEVIGLLTYLDMSHNLKLQHLNCKANQLTTLVVSNNSALTHIDCSFNPLAALNVSNNASLTQLLCYYNQLTSLDVSNNTALTDLCCENNQLTSLDVSNNTALTRLECGFNQMTSLDVSYNASLSQLLCENNQLSSLDVSNNSSLTWLQCYDNQLTSLAVSNNTGLTGLWCFDNQLSSLDVSNNTALTLLGCSDNQLSFLDVSHNTALTLLSCSDNQLTTLDVSNNLSLSSLYCDNSTMEYLYMMAGQEIADFSKNDVTEIVYKGALPTAFPDENFCTYVFSNFDINNDGKLSYDEIQLVTRIDVGSKNIYSLEGIELFENLHILFCLINQLTALDVSHNTALRQLECDYNQLTALDVSNNIALESLHCSNNQLTSLDVGNNTALWDLQSSRNQLTALNVSNNTALTVLRCNYNQLTSLDVGNNTALWDLQCAGNQLSVLNVSNNTALANLTCNENPRLTEIWLKTGQTFSSFSYDANIATIYYKD